VVGGIGLASVRGTACALPFIGDVYRAARCNAAIFGNNNIMPAGIEADCLAVATELKVVFTFGRHPCR
jgi:hypothetical protein